MCCGTPSEVSATTDYIFEWLNSINKSKSIPAEFKCIFKLSQGAALVEIDVEDLS